MSYCVLCNRLFCSSRPRSQLNPRFCVLCDGVGS